MKIRNKFASKVIAVTLVITILNQAIMPTIAYGLTGGPKSPEFSEFSPVAATDMVNLLSGDFQYSIPVLEVPGPDGAGYALSLSYNSNVNSEMEASWVGLGWTLNPGAINRNTRGIPDDYKGASIAKYNKSRPNWTIASTHLLNYEFFSADLKLGLNSALRFNNYKGYHRSVGFGIDIKGLGLNLNLDQEKGITFTPQINPRKALNKKDREVKSVEQKRAALKDAVNDSKVGYKGLLKQGLSGAASSAGISMTGLARANLYNLYLFSESNTTSSYTDYSGHSWNYEMSLQLNPSQANYGVQTGLSSNFNIQFNDYYKENEAFGFYNSGHAEGNVLMDYYVEKESYYNKRDLFIGMPFTNYDIFNVQGEGVGGGFRAIPDKIGNLKPHGGESKMKIRSAGVEVMVGLNIGMGVDFGFGNRKSSLKNWGGSTAYGTNFHFRFNNDMGGSVDYCNGNTSAETTYMHSRGGFGTKRVSTRDLLSDDRLHALENPSRASYIKEYTKAECRNESFPADVADNVIVKFEVTNENGVTYTYGKPVFIKNETNLSIDIDNSNIIEDNFLAFKELPLVNKDGKYIVSKEGLLGDDLKTVIGEVKLDEYAVIYLLTAITGSDFVDVDGDNAPSEKDFGGWTKFNYTKVYGENQSAGWYRFRTPYKGFYYNQGSLSDNMDETGTVYTGEKEVYYLESVETKSHIAWFVTNQYEKDPNNTKKTKASKYAFPDGEVIEREDGLSAQELEASGDPAAKKSYGKGTKHLRFLERIELFSKSRPEKPIKTVHFEYDYSLVRNIPNSSSVKGNGKLTLKKLWFEYEGVNTLKTSPYEFKYYYEHSAYFKTGQDLFSETDDLSPAEQLPPYSPHLMDPWGNVMPYAKARKKLNIPWIYQGEIPAKKNGSENDDWRFHIEGSDVNFDPAAWCLKQIKLPSGGEMHIQYEQKDYRYVQDRDVMAVVSLRSDFNNDEGMFRLNLDDLGVDDENEAEVEELRKAIEDYYSKTKIFYKFLYSLTTSDAKLDNNLSEYIEGYAQVRGVELEESNGKYAIKILLNEDDLPKKACREFYRANRKGVLDSKGSPPLYVEKYEHFFRDYANNEQNNTAEGKIGDYDDFGKSAARRLNLLKNGAIPSMAAMEFDRFLPLKGPKGGNAFMMSKKNDEEFFVWQICNNLNPFLSYLKVPMTKAKRGGGNRVKQVMLYDKGIEDGSAVVYGNRYHYVLEDGKTSSGVATNEPTPAREENPLVTYMPRKGQGLFSRLTVGEDKKQTEGPLGQSLLPGANVIHSRVVVENIHTGKTGTGFSVNEYYTTKDFPYDRYYKEITDESENIMSDADGAGVEKTSLGRTIDNLIIPAPFLSMKISKVWMAQGFRFIQNSMNGKQKRTSVYGGVYGTGDTGLADTEKGYLISQTQYDYFEPGEKVQLLEWKGSNYVADYRVPGKEVDIAVEKKMFKDATTDFSLELDPCVALAVLPIPFVTFFPSFSYSETIVATHSNTKVISYPAIVRKVTTYQEGMVSEKENIAFDAANGKPLVTRSTDSYTGIEIPGEDAVSNASYYSFNVPAHWIYESLGQKATATDDETRSNQLSASFMNILSYGEGDAQPTQNWVTKSDENISLNATNVLSASVQTYKKDWNANSWGNKKISSRYGIPEGKTESFNQYVRPWSTYNYVKDNQYPDNKNGTYNITSSMFSLSQDGYEQGAEWLRGTSVTKYSPNGNPLEECNAQGIFSAAMYDKYKEFMVPAMIAANAKYESIHFASESEEKKTMSSLVHSGDKSIVVTSADNILEENVFVSDHLKNKGAYVNLWVYYDRMNGLVCSSGSHVFPYKKVAEVDNWALVQIDLSSAYFESLSNGEGVELYLKNKMHNVIIDDIKFQPKDAQSTCYVYDDALRLIAQFDDQHFGTYFQYNEEGKLVRKIIETERGKKTIQETHYNTPKKLK